MVGSANLIVTAPVRVCDAGGWTDTWFAGSGVVCNLAVRPGVRVDLDRRDDGRVTFATPPTPLLEAAVAEAGASGVHVTVRSAVPAASSLGTSASVTVALLAGLGVPRRELARRAHRVETERLGLQSGVQDQVAAAAGGASLIEIDYPTARRRPLPIPAGIELVTIFLGPHASSAVHEQVIADLRTDSSALDELRRCARDAAAALEDGDVRRYGAALAANTEAQRALHPSLVSADAQRVIDAARSAGALGWKVNGAGGDGGTVTVVCAAGRSEAFARDWHAGHVAERTASGSVLRLRPSRQGVRVTG